MKFKKAILLFALSMIFSGQVMADVYVEDFADPLGGWTSDWLYLNSNMENYYVASGDCNPDNRGNNPSGLWISDDRGCGTLSYDSPVQIDILNGFGDAATQFSIGICNFREAITLNVYDKDGILDQSTSLASGCPGVGVSLVYTNYPFNLANGISRFEFAGTNVEGAFAIDDVSISTDAVVDLPERATFYVTKDFTDDNPMPVEVTLTCNGGLPLTQSFVLSDTETPVQPVQNSEADEGVTPSPFSSVTFVLTNFVEGETDCTVVENSVPADYSVSYDDGTVSDVNCSYDDITSGAFSCAITNTPVPGEYTVEVDWVITDEGFEGDPGDVGVSVTCQSNILTVNGSVVAPSTTYMGSLGDGESVVLGIDTTTGTSSCSTTQLALQSGVEPEASADCTDGAVNAAGETTCTFTNTLFYEGIPTLSQWSMALMALLMLGVGFIGFRRFG